jgi:hypothetical protein
MGPRIAVDPTSYESASMAFGLDIAHGVELAGLGLLQELAGSAEMAGSDPAGQAWASAYDEAAATTVGVTQDVVNACYQLAALLQQTGFNYVRADASSTPGMAQMPPDITDYAGCSCHLGRPPSAKGGSGSPPGHWWIVEHTVGYVWPGGHQDRLRSAVEAWTAGASAIGDATLYVQNALSCITRQVTPEVDDALTACQAMDRHLWDLEAAYEAMAGTCSQYADYIDHAHHEIEHELANLLGTSVLIQGLGFATMFVTAGGSEVAAQTAQEARITATAIKIANIIRRLIELAKVLAETISNAAARVVRISRDLKGLLGARISVATTDAVRALPPVTKTAEAVAVSDLGAAEAAGGALEASELSAGQASNYARYVKKLPSGAQDPVITRGANGSVQFSAEVPGRVPGSYATYTKVVDGNGSTTDYYKTTVAPDGSIVHVKIKFP